MYFIFGLLFIFAVVLENFLFYMQISCYKSLKHIAVGNVVEVQYRIPMVADDFGRLYT